MTSTFLDPEGKHDKIFVSMATVIVGQWSGEC